MAKAGTSAFNLSNKALFAELEPIIGELKGSSAGDALMTSYNRLNGIVKLPNQVTHDLMKMGVYRRPYSIEVAIVANNASPLKVDALTGALQGLLDSDIGQALGLSDIIDVATVTSAVTTVQSAVKEVTDFAHVTVEQVQAVVRPIIAAQTIVQQQISQLESAASQITTLGGLVPGNPISTTVSNLLSQADQSTRIPALYSLQNALGRLNKNVNSGQTADGVRTVTLSGGNLYQVASDQYGDASLWSSIASANDLTDPQLSGINMLTIPANPTS